MANMSHGDLVAESLKSIRLGPIPDRCCLCGRSEGDPLDDSPTGISLIQLRHKTSGRRIALCQSCGADWYEIVANIIREANAFERFNSLLDLLFGKKGN